MWEQFLTDHPHTSMRLAAHAANSATASAICTLSPEVLRVVLMTAKTSGDSTQGVSDDIFRGIHESFTTQERPNRPPTAIWISPGRETGRRVKVETPSDQAR